MIGANMPQFFYCVNGKKLGSVKKMKKTLKKRFVKISIYGIICVKERNHD